MALKKCKECGNQVSTNADACPMCGAKQVRTSKFTQGVVILIALIVMLPLLDKCGGSPSSSPSTSSSSPSATAPQATVAPTPPPPPEPGSQWYYRQETDPMASGTTYHAVVTSTNTVEFDFPYNRPQRARLHIRTHPRHGKDVIFQIERGQILCRSYEDCTVLVRFDDQKAQSYSAVGAADSSTESAFIHNYSRFMGQLLKAKTVRISVEIYQQGSPVFEFDVSGFDVEKYRPSK